jgi:hypothetical protein
VDLLTGGGGYIYIYLYIHIILYYICKYFIHLVTATKVSKWQPKCPNGEHTAMMCVRNLRSQWPLEERRLLTLFYRQQLLLGSTLLRLLCRVGKNWSWFGISLGSILVLVWCRFVFSLVYVGDRFGNNLKST